MHTYGQYCPIAKAAEVLGVTDKSPTDVGGASDRPTPGRWARSMGQLTADATLEVSPAACRSGSPHEAGRSTVPQEVVRIMRRLSRIVLAAMLMLPLSGSVAARSASEDEDIAPLATLPMGRLAFSSDRVRP